MESSREGRLGLKKIRDIQGKGRTFSQVSSILQKNNGPSSMSQSLIFSPLPLKLHRRELAMGPFSRKQSIRGLMEIPGGNVVNSDSNICNQQENTFAKE